MHKKIFVVCASLALINISWCNTHEIPDLAKTRQGSYFTRTSIAIGAIVTCVIGYGLLHKVSIETDSILKTTLTTQSNMGNMNATRLLNAFSSPEPNVLNLGARNILVNPVSYESWIIAKLKGYNIVAHHWWL